MKKLLLTLTIVAGLCLCANAQSDAFFSYSDVNSQERSGIVATPGLPNQGLYADQSAPVGSGLLLLAGMGLAYAMRRKQS